jgi:hypothetical protein
MSKKYFGGVKLIALVHDRAQFRASVNTFWGTIKEGFLDQLGNH